MNLESYKKLRDQVFHYHIFPAANIKQVCLSASLLPRVQL
jgi:hypothetical protein